MSVLSSQNQNTFFVTLPTLTLPITRAQARTLASNMYQLQNVDMRMLWAISIVAKCRTLNHKGTWSTNYVTNKTQLVSDSEAFLGTFDNLIFDYQDSESYVFMQAVLDWNSANNSDASTPDTINGLIIEAGILISMPQSTLRQIYQYLRYQIG